MTDIVTVSDLHRAVRACKGGETLVLPAEFDTTQGPLKGLAPPAQVTIDCSAITVRKEWVAWEPANLTFSGGDWRSRLNVHGGRNLVFEGATAVGFKATGTTNLEVRRNLFSALVSVVDSDGVHLHHNVTLNPGSDAYNLWDCCDVVLEWAVVMGLSHQRPKHPDVVQLVASKRVNRGIVVRNLMAEGVGQGLFFQSLGARFADVTLADVTLCLGLKRAVSLDSVDGAQIGRVTLTKCEDAEGAPAFLFADCTGVTDLGGNTTYGRAKALTAL